MIIFVWQKLKKKSYLDFKKLTRFSRIYFLFFYSLDLKQWKCRSKIEERKKKRGSELNSRVNGDNTTNKVLVLHLLKSCLSYHWRKSLLHSFSLNLPANYKRVLILKTSYRQQTLTIFPRKINEKLKNYEPEEETDEHSQPSTGKILGHRQLVPLSLE